MTEEGKRIAILVNDYFEDSELQTPFNILKTAGADITIISGGKRELNSMEGPRPKRTFKADLLLADANSKNYDVLVLPGGILNSNSLRMNEKAQSWAIDFLDSKRLVAASGYASLLLVSADMVEEKQITSPPEIQDDIRNAGGEWTNRPVVIAKNLITGRGREASKKFAEAILKHHE